MQNSKNEDYADTDISPAVLAGAALVGAKDGITSALADKAEDARSQAAAFIEPGDQRQIPHPWENFKSRVLWTYNYLATPGDMNLKHSPHPAETAMQLHTALVNQTADTLTEQGLVEGVRLISAAVATIALDSADPLKKIHAADSAVHAANVAESLLTKPAIGWHAYAHLLGAGTQPPKLKPLRDFSDLMEYTPPKPGNEYTRLSYTPELDHEIIIDLTHRYDRSDASNPVMKFTYMEFVVQAQGDSNGHGNGPEMFHSANKLLRAHGINITRIEGNWGHGELSSNYDAFAKALAEGATVKEAVSKTSTGRWAGDAGFTEVGGRHFNQTLSGGKLSGNLHPEFIRPQFYPEHEAYNQYGDAFALAHGRPNITLVPRGTAAPGEQLKGLTGAQQQVVRQQIQDKVAKTFNLGNLPELLEAWSK